MTWSYTPSATPTTKDLVRLYIGDTLREEQQVQDEEILAVLADEGNSPTRAVVTLADALASRYARQVSMGQRGAHVIMQHYLDLAARWRRKMARTGIQPFAGGLSIAQKQAVESNTDRVAPFFTRQIDTEPGTEPVTDTTAPPPPVYY